MTIRLLHTADWQLGKPFANITGDAGALLRSARFEAVARLAELATRRGADAVLVAGDAFDGNMVADDTLHRALAAMRGFTGPWLMLPGNHDAALAASVWTRLAEAGLPGNVVPLLEPVALTLCDGRLAVLAAPLTTRHVVEDLTAWMDTAVTPAGVIRVGVAHGSVTGFLPDQADAPNPIDPARATKAGLDYLALGDWHGAMRIDERSWYAGTPEPDRFKANDAGHALLVRLDEPGVAPLVERVQVGRYRWTEMLLDDTAGQGLLPTRLEAALDAIEEPADSLVRLHLRGVADLSARERLGRLIERRGAAFVHMDVDWSGLEVTASEADLAPLDDGGAIGATAERLRAQAADRPEAALALRLLHRLASRVQEGPR